jgi:hypothetical protein
MRIHTTGRRWQQLVTAVAAYYFLFVGSTDVLIDDRQNASLDVFGEACTIFSEFDKENKWTEDDNKLEAAMFPKQPKTSPERDTDLQHQGKSSDPQAEEPENSVCLLPGTSIQALDPNIWSVAGKYILRELK